MMAERGHYRFPSAVSHNSVVGKSIYEEFRSSSRHSKLDKSWFPSQNLLQEDFIQDFSKIHIDKLKNHGKFVKKTRKSSNKNYKRIESLARPKYLTKKYTNDDEKISTIDLTPLKPNRYRSVTPRLLRLAEPKIWIPIPTNPLGKVPERALRATANKRIVELATPRWKTEPILKPEKIIDKNYLKTNTRDLKSTSYSKNVISEYLQNYLDRAYKGPWKKIY